MPRARVVVRVAHLRFTLHASLDDLSSPVYLLKEIRVMGITHAHGIVVSKTPHKPIFIIGCHRSGTSLCGNILSRHPDVAYWEEPKGIWTYGNAYRADEQLDASDLTPSIRAHLDRSFSGYLERAARVRLVEKTPCNCLRVPFMVAAYPNCKIVHMIRDGRNVVQRLDQMQQRGPSTLAVMKRLRETAWWEWPAYFPTFCRTYCRTALMRKRSSFWGAKPRGCARVEVFTSVRYRRQAVERDGASGKSGWSGFGQKSIPRGPIRGANR